MCLTTECLKGITRRVNVITFIPRGSSISGLCCGSTGLVTVTIWSSKVFGVVGEDGGMYE